MPALPRQLIRIMIMGGSDVRQYKKIAVGRNVSWSTYVRFSPVLAALYLSPDLQANLYLTLEPTYTRWNESTLSCLFPVPLHCTGPLSDYDAVHLECRSILL